jgi:hypothetical protein
LDLATKLTQNPEDPNTANYGLGTGELWPKFDAVPMISGRDLWTAEALETGFFGPLKITDPAVVDTFQTFHDLAYVEVENTRLAWTFVKFLTSKDQQAAYTKATGTPPVRASLLDGYYKQFGKCMPPDQVKQVFTGAFSHGRESSNHLLVG